MKGKTKYIYSLDSMRVLAMLGVMLFHLFPTKVKGGFLGVTTFFVLSGFLTMREIVQNGNLNPLLSIGSKFRKLMPELIVMVFVTLVVMTLSLSEYLPDTKNQAISSAFGVNNIVQILDGESYFEAMASLKPFTHIWAHSMELQFYFLLLFTAGAFYKGKNKRYWLVGFSFLAVLSVSLMQILYIDPQNVTRIYYGTDTRIFSFLIGAIGAILFSDQKQALVLRDGIHSTLAIVLMAISAILFFVVENGEAVYRYLFFLYSLMQLFLIFLLSNKKTTAYRIFSKNLVVMISKRSYSMYLWHFPVMKLYEKMMWSRQIPVAWYIILEFLLIFGVTEFFYRLFQEIRMRTAQANQSHLRNKRRHKAAAKKRKPWGYVLSLFLLIGICVYPYRPVGAMANQKYLMLLRLKNQITDVDVNIGGVKKTSVAMTTTLETSISVSTTSSTSPISETETSSASAQTPSEQSESSQQTSTAEESLRQTESGVTETEESDTSSSATAEITTEITTETALEESSTVDIATANNTASDSSSVMTSSTSSATMTSSTSSADTGGEIPTTETTAADSTAEDPEIAHIREVFEYCKKEFPGVDISFEEYLKIRDRKITLIGDSISVMTSPKLVEFFPNIEISAKTNRQTYHAYEFYSQMKAEGRVGDVVILALGANGHIDYENYDKVREDLGGKPMIINTVILPWPVTEAERNEAIYKYAKDHKNVYLAKWFEHCKDKPGILYDDGVHPIETDGAIAHAYVMMEAVYEALIKGQK